VVARRTQRPKVPELSVTRLVYTQSWMIQRADLELHVCAHTLLIPIQDETEALEEKEGNVLMSMVSQLVSRIWSRRQVNNAGQDSS